MKKALLPLAIAAVMPMSVSMSAFAFGPEEAQVYGKVNLTLDSIDYTDTADSTNNYSETETNTNASRLGIKGKVGLSEDLSFIYQAEYELYADESNGDTKNYKQRNTFIGLTGTAGTIIAGRHDTPTKKAQKKIDLFNDLSGDIKRTFEGENRVSDIIIYTSPKMGNFSASVAKVTDAKTKHGEDVDDTDGNSVSVSWEADGLYLAVAADKEIDGQDLVRVVAQYKMDALQLGAMYQQNENSQDSDKKDESGYFVSAAYKLDGGYTLKAQYGELENDANDSEEETLSLGVDYKLAKSTKLFAYYTQNTDTDASSDEKETEVLGLGIEYKF